MSAATIGSALTERRLTLGLEKGQAADKIGMSRTTYSSYEQDAQRPSADVFPALAGFLEVSLEDFLNLYGATCIAAVRPSLDRILSMSEHVSAEAPIATDAPIAPNVSTTAQVEESRGHSFSPAGSADEVAGEASGDPETTEQSASEEPTKSRGAPQSVAAPDPPKAETDVDECVTFDSDTATPVPASAKSHKPSGREKDSVHKKKKKKKKKS